MIPISAESMVAFGGAVVAAIIGAWGTIRAAELQRSPDSRPRFRTSLWKRVSNWRHSLAHPAAIAGLTCAVLLGSYFASPRLAGAEIKASLATVGVYRDLMGTFLSMFQNGNHRYKIAVKPIETQGSTQTITQLEDKTANIGLIQRNSQPDGTVRAIASIYDEYYFLLKAPGHPCSSPADLKKANNDKPFRIATLGEESQTYSDLEKVLSALGFEEDDYSIEATPEGYKKALGKIRDSEDTPYGFFITGLSNPQLAESIKNAECELLPINHNEAMALKMPGTEATSIPEGYFGDAFQNEYNTIKTTAILACSSELSPDLIYEITKTLFEGKALMAQEFAAHLNISEVPTEQRLLFPVHRGALRYYDRAEPGLLMKNQFWVSTLLGLLGIAFTVTAPGKRRTPSQVVTPGETQVVSK